MAAPQYGPHVDPSTRYRLGKALGLFFDRRVTYLVAGVTAGTIAGFAIGGIPGKWYTRWAVNLGVAYVGRGISQSFGGETGAFGTGLVIGSGLSFGWDTVGPLVRGYKAVEGVVLGAGAAISSVPLAVGSYLSKPYLGLPIVGF